MEAPLDQTAPSSEPTAPENEKAPTRLQVFVNKHPQAAKVVAITGAVIAGLGTVHVAKTVSARKDHLASAGEHVGEALSEVAASVSPEDPKA